MEHIMGDKVSATNPETITAPASVSANSTNSRPVRPGVKATKKRGDVLEPLRVEQQHPVSRLSLLLNRSRDRTGLLVQLSVGRRCCLRFPVPEEREGAPLRLNCRAKTQQLDQV